MRLTDFNETTACRPGEGPDCERELEQALRDLKRQGATAYILDIRDNPGGLLDQAFAVSNLFLKKGQLVVFTRGRTRRDESNYITEEESPWSSVPLVVLTSRHSASASEIVAGALQDHDRALIVGETTFGKGLVQTIMPLRNVRGYALALTTARYYTPSGRSIQRDYAKTALEEYYSPRDRKPCEVGNSDPKLTDAGRKVFGGDGITPDYCVEQETTNKFVSYLIARQAFAGFARGYDAARTARTARRSPARARARAPPRRKSSCCPRDFKVDDAMLGGLQGLPGQPQAPFHGRGARAEPRRDRAPDRRGDPAPGLGRGRGAAQEHGLGPAGEEGARARAHAPSCCCATRRPSSHSREQ